MDYHLHKITIFHSIWLFREKIYHIAVKLVEIISFYGRPGASCSKHIVSLTISLRRQLVKYMPTKLSNTLLFFVGKM